MQKLLTFFFCKNISVNATLNDQSFSDTLTNNIVRVEQLGPDEKESTLKVNRLFRLGAEWFL